MTQRLSAIYTGAVVHQRLKPRRHRLRYRVFSLLLDLDGLAELDRRSRVFSHNRSNLLSFRDRDHGPGDDTPLRPWVDRTCAEAGVDLSGGRVLLLCYPRLLGYVFNPLSVYFCYTRDERLAALLYEVRNTFGERHTYAIPVDDTASPVVRQQCAKEFYVSPFIAMEGTYQFRLKPPGDDIAIAIRQSDADGPLLDASFTGKRSSLTDKNLLRTLAKHPLMVVKVIGGIHWEALKLWRKGLPIFKHSAPPATAVTIVGHEHG